MNPDNQSTIIARMLQQLGSGQQPQPYLPQIPGLPSNPTGPVRAQADPEMCGPDSPLSAFEKKKMGCPS